MQHLSNPKPAPLKRSINWYHPLEVVDWEFVEQGTIIRDFVAQPQEFVRILLRDATVILARRHPTARHRRGGNAKLYGTEGEHKAFFSLSSKGFNENKPNWTKSWEENHPGGSVYVRLRDFIDDDRTGGILAHHAMYEIWHGKRDPECHIHHLNREKFDYCEANLIQLRAKIEHPNADARQRLVESAVGDLHRLTYQRLRELTLMPNNEFLHELQKLREK